MQICDIFKTRTVQFSCLSYITYRSFVLKKKSLPPGSSPSYKSSIEALEILEFDCCKKIILSTYVVFPENGLSSFRCKQYFITFDPSELRVFLDLPMMAACFFKSVSDNEEPSLKNFIFLPRQFVKICPPRFYYSIVESFFFLNYVNIKNSAFDFKCIFNFLTSFLD